MIFGIEINKLIKWLIPHFLYKPKHKAWLETLLSAVAWLYAQFLIYRDEKLYEATTNSQVSRLTHALIRKFGDDRIYIIHPDDFLDQAYIYLEIEGATPEWDWLAEEEHTPVDYDFLAAEYDNQYDFIVRIPAEIAGQAELIRAFVNKYKFSSKIFNVETF